MATQGKAEIVVTTKDEASAKLKTIGTNATNMGKQFGNAGKSMMAAGGAIVGALGATAKAAEDERLNVAKLSQSLENVGVSYDDVKESLEGVIAATQQKTGIADDAQREAMSSLIQITGSYDTALGLLPVALDLAKAKSIDLTTAAEILGKVNEGNTGILSRYGIVVGENATASEALAAINDRVKGSAEALASPLEIMQANMGDIAEGVGTALLPSLNELITKLSNGLLPILKWVEDHPDVFQGILKFGVAILAAGGLLFAISKAIAAFNAIRNAITGISVAFTIMQGITGVGLLKVAAGLAGAAALTAGIIALSNSGNSNSSIEENIPETNGVVTTTNIGGPLPGYATGGTVPGPAGKPITVVAHGGEMFGGLNNAYRGGLGSGIVVNVNVQGSVKTERELVQSIREELLKIQRRNMTTGLV